MPMFNKNMENGYNKFRQHVEKNHYFRKANNTLNQINNYALPSLSVASAFIPAAAPVFGTVATILKGSQQITGILNK